MTRESDVGERFLLLAEDESAPMPMDQGWGGCFRDCGPSASSTTTLTTTVTRRPTCLFLYLLCAGWSAALSVQYCTRSQGGRTRDFFCWNANACRDMRNVHARSFVMNWLCHFPAISRRSVICAFPAYCLARHLYRMMEGDTRSPSGIARLVTIAVYLEEIISGAAPATSPTAANVLLSAAHPGLASALALP
ncbi:hypothetical protein OE88DRAFT_931201 [Heliocybe sulcata]|uniref:Uncharacterized protein n=1 Tax=Heliocybe sulcata TaxID=5364 RepID=A0A5C3NCJ3_9AGAM|nr:hypothetical protein OE88DRAFT_931201 [Heliocybe sulcata]